MAKQKAKSSDSDELLKGAPELVDEGAQKEAIAEESVSTNDSTSDRSISDKDAVETENDKVEGTVQTESGHQNLVQRLARSYWRRKKLTLPLTVTAILLVIAAIPVTRIAIASQFVSQSVVVTVVDKSTKKPVSSADVTIAGKTAKTDAAGKATVDGVKVGDRIVTISKKYYKDETFSLQVPISKAATRDVSLIATGRQVPISVINKISGKPLFGVLVKSSGTDVKTDKDGKAVIVLPADKTDLPISFTMDGFNNAESRVRITDQVVKENTYPLTPNGKVYFLSKATGKIDVVKTDLDGANRQTIVAGTGKELEANTVLLASRDWKYLALLAKRDSGLPRLYLIETATDKMSEMDAGNAEFRLIGWNDHDFVYRVERQGYNSNQANRIALKSFNADRKQITTIDQNTSSEENGVTIYQEFSTAYILGGKLVYPINYIVSTPYYYYGVPSRPASILRVATISNNTKKDVKSWPPDQFNGYVGSRPYGVDELYLNTYSYAKNKLVFFEYENGTVKDAPELDNEKYSSSYPTYLISPDAKRTFWTEQRDGKQTFYVGDSKGENEKQVSTLEDGQVYGWYGDNYVLMSKKGSELYIMPVDGSTPVKVTDYHKPEYSYYGYGGGYGGL